MSRQAAEEAGGASEVRLAKGPHFYSRSFVYLQSGPSWIEKLEDFFFFEICCTIGGFRVAWDSVLVLLDYLVPSSSI